MGYVNGWTLLAQFRLNAYCPFDQSYGLKLAVCSLHNLYVYMGYFSDLAWIEGVDW